MRNAIKASVAYMAAANGFQLFSEITDEARPTVGSYVNADTLREAAEDTDKLIGAVANYKYLTAGDSLYNATLAAQFDLLTAENGCKLSQVGKKEGTLQWEKCDEALAFAQANDMKFKFHNIIWAKYDRTPEYLWNLTASELEQWAYDYIDTIADRYGS